VIDDVDASLVAFLTDGLGQRATVTIDPPEESWREPRKGAPTLSCFLHRVQEDISWLSAAWQDVRDETGRMEGRIAPPRHYRLHYLVSAWAESTAAEHRLLGDLLRVVNRFPVVPAEFAAGSLADRPEHIRLWVAAPEPAAGVDVLDVWRMLGVGAKAVLELVVGAVLISEIDTELAPPAETMTLDMAKVDGRPGRSAAEGAVAGSTEEATSSGDGGGPPGGPVAGPAGSGVGPADRKWTAFRLREHTPNDPKQ
jgi:Pvc16 N-terminal domain